MIDALNIKEQLLLRKCRKGDAKAQFQIYQQYYKAMYNVALRLLSHTAEAEDVMQESFLTAFKKLDTFSGEVSFGAWLRKIVVNRSLDVLRQRKIVLDEIEPHHQIDGDDVGIQDVEQKLKLVKNIINEMPQNYRVLLTLHLFEGYSHDEIGEMLDMKHGAVRTAYTRAKKKLQLQLEASKVKLYD